LIYLFHLHPQSTPPPASPTEAIPPIQKEPPLHVIEGNVKEGSTLFKSMAEKDIQPRWIDLVVSKLKPHVNFKKVKGGTYRFIADEKGEMVKFLYEVGPTEVYEVERDFQGYIAQKKEVPMETYLIKVVGEIRSSLFEAMDAMGEKDQLTIAFADVLAWEVDFYKDVREGDRFKVVMEKVYKGNAFIRYGPIHAVEYQGKEKIIRGIGYQGDYYHENGISLRKAFLKSPLRFNRISSRFSRARRHPILGGIKPHFGVDYAAPPGTPVWAVGEGVIVACGWNEGYGKQVIIRHMNGYMTYYAHLSYYGQGIRVNQRVKQKQIIGYVGSTGLSTGPHLDYRVTKSGHFRNPLKESFPEGVPIGKGRIEGFKQRRDEAIAWFDGDTPFRKRVGEGGE
jgi:murein DD-endopeptidase MepM/ murein hydrolase activator NlpD